MNRNIYFNKKRLKCDTILIVAIFMNMKELNQQLRVRLTVCQMRSLIDTITTTQKSKSTIVRDALDDYLDDDKCRTENQNKK